MNLNQSGASLELTRRDLLRGATALAAANAAVSAGNAAVTDTPPGQAMIPHTTNMRLQINGRTQEFALDPRTTLLDALREHAGLTGTKKGCDHGQCGACTVLIEGRRINSCLTLAVMHDGQSVTTIEGLAQGEKLHPLQEAFVRHDGLQCGYCTPGQICSAVGMLAEAKAGMPSHVSAKLEQPLLDAAEIRERMSGNICRCGAYSNIVDAITEVHGASA